MASIFAMKRRSYCRSQCASDVGWTLSHRHIVWGRSLHWWRRESLKSACLHQNHVLDKCAGRSYLARACSTPAYKMYFFVLSLGSRHLAGDGEKLTQPQRISSVHPCSLLRFAQWVVLPILPTLIAPQWFHGQGHNRSCLGQASKTFAL
jgi:hypothetical protein